MSEFDGVTQDMRQDILTVLRGTEPVPEETDPKVLEAEARQLAADKLRVGHVMRMPADEATADDNAFLRAQINETLKTL